VREPLPGSPPTRTGSLARAGCRELGASAPKVSSAHLSGPRIGSIDGRALDAREPASLLCDPGGSRPRARIRREESLAPAVERSRELRPTRTEGEVTRFGERRRQDLGEHQAESKAITRPPIARTLLVAAVQELGGQVSQGGAARRSRVASSRAQVDEARVPRCWVARGALAPIEQDVRRLDITVRDASRVEVAQSLADVAGRRRSLRRDTPKPNARARIERRARHHGRREVNDPRRKAAWAPGGTLPTAINSGRCAERPHAKRSASGRSHVASPVERAISAPRRDRSRDRGLARLRSLRRRRAARPFETPRARSSSGPHANSDGGMINEGTCIFCRIFYK